MEAKKRSKKWKIGRAVVLALVLIGVAAWLWPASRPAQLRSVAWVEARSSYVLTAPGLDTLYCADLQPDTTFRTVALAEAGLSSVVRANGCWVKALPLVPAWRGRLLTLSRLVPSDTVSRGWNARLSACLSHQQTRTRHRLQGLERALHEYRYYLRTHTVQDEGYAWVADEFVHLRRRHDSLARALRLLDTLSRSGRARLSRHLRLVAYAATDSGVVSPQGVACRLQTIDRRRGWAVWQPAGGRLPDGAVALPIANFLPLLRVSAVRPRVVQAVAFNFPSALPLSAKACPTALHGRLWREGRKWIIDLPVLSGAEGAPVLDGRGRVMGLAGGQGLVRPAAWWHLFKED